MTDTTTDITMTTEDHPFYTIHIDDDQAAFGYHSWRVDLGPFGPTVITFADSIEAAEEQAAAYAKDREWSVFVEPDYAEAAEELGLVWDPIGDWDDVKDRIATSAEADLSYTESGYLVAYETSARETSRELYTRALWAIAEARIVGAMRPVVEHGRWITGETDYGEGFVVPEGFDVPDDADSETVETIEGYGARLSMPGYLDCTEWSVFDSEAEALVDLIANWGE